MKRTQNLYTYEAVMQAVNQLIDNGYQCWTIEDNALLDSYIMTPENPAWFASERYPVYEFRAVAVNEWTSAYKVRRHFKSLPKRLTSELESVGWEMPTMGQVLGAILLPPVQ